MSELNRAVETARLGACRQMWCRIGRLGLVLGLFGSVWSVSAGVSAQNLEPLTNVQQVAAGENHTCALLNSGEVYCWGRNDSGQLGDGTTSERLTPVAVSELSGVTAITAGYSHTCALLIGGEVRCWGYNGRGQLGDGTATFRPFPAPVLIDVGLFSNGFEAP